MTEAIGIDHIYIAVSDLARSEAFYDRVMLEVLGFRKNRFTLNGNPHLQYFNRHHGLVLRPASNPGKRDSDFPGLASLLLSRDVNS